jgi:hypothetical protein
MTAKYPSIHAVFAAALGLLAVTPTALAEEAPKRKPGLLPITTIGAGTGMSTTEICILGVIVNARVIRGLI